MKVTFSKYPSRFAGIKTELDGLEVPSVGKITVVMDPNELPKVTLDIFTIDVAPFELEHANVVINRHDVRGRALFQDLLDNCDFPDEWLLKVEHFLKET